MICTQQDVKKLGRILGIWAHPDDETFTMGGIMAAAVQNGQFVACITATRGEKGVQDENRWPAKDLGQIRTDELTAAMKILGVNELCWLDYPDGDCKSIDKKRAVDELVVCIDKYQPDSIFTFGPEGLTGHPDHRCACDWTQQAVKQSGSHAKVYTCIQTHQQYDAMRAADEQFNIFFNIEKPPVCDPDTCAVCFSLSDELYDLKLRALKAMPSQYDALLRVFEPTLRSSLGTEPFVEAR